MSKNNSSYSRKIQQLQCYVIGSAEDLSNQIIGKFIYPDGVSLFFSDDSVYVCKDSSFYKRIPVQAVNIDDIISWKNQYNLAHKDDPINTKEITKSKFSMDFPDSIIQRYLNMLYIFLGIYKSSNNENKSKLTIPNNNTKPIQIPIPQPGYVRVPNPPPQPAPKQSPTLPEKTQLPKQEPRFYLPNAPKQSTALPNKTQLPKQEPRVPPQPAPKQSPTLPEKTQSPKQQTAPKVPPTMFETQGCSVSQPKGQTIPQQPVPKTSAWGDIPKRDTSNSHIPPENYRFGSKTQPSQSESSASNDEQLNGGLSISVPLINKGIDNRAIEHLLSGFQVRFLPYFYHGCSLVEVKYSQDQEGILENIVMCHPEYFYKPLY